MIPLIAVVGCSADVGPTLSVADADRPVVAVSSSYLAAVVTDLLGEAQLVPLAAPGMCPGHFDLRPSQIEQLASATLVLRFDFQNGLEEKLVGRLGGGMPVVSVSVPGGMCDPAAYESACRQVADVLVGRGMLGSEQAEARMASIAARMVGLRQWMQSQVKQSGWSGRPVVTSVHQQAFCRQLGLDVVATLTAADTARASTLDDAVVAGERAGAKWIIANRPEGRRLADVVADRLGATVLVFGNFPANDRPEAFDRLVRANVRVLLAGAEK